MPATLTILVPWLLQGASGHSRNRGDLPCIETLLAKADWQQQRTSSNAHAIAAEFGLSCDGAAAPAFADICAAYDLDTVETGWCRVDPVYLRPDPNALLLFDACNFELSESEADDLLAHINADLEGPDIVRGHDPKRWFIRLLNLATLKTQTSSALNGLPLSRDVPRDEAGQTAAQLITNIQMLLHSAPVNDLRESAGLVPINSVWLWGNGQLPEAVARAPDLVLSDEGLAAALAQKFNVRYLELAAGLDQWQSESAGNILFIIEAAELAWPALEEDLFAPALGALRRGRFATIRVILHDRTLVLKRHHLWRIWRRTLSVTDYVESIKP